MSNDTIWTIGYEGRSAEEFEAFLRAHCIDLVIDVRRWPYTRRETWANRNRLSHLSNAVPGCPYVSWPELGNRKGAVAGAWEMIDAEEAWATLRHLQRLVERSYRIALLCRERDPMTCHRAHVAGRAAPHVIHIR